MRGKGSCMKRQLAMAAAVCAMLLGLTGCVEVHQLVKMNRDGSGTLTERVRVLPRAVRLMAGRMAREGQAAEGFKVLTDAALEKRVKAIGGVTVKSKTQKTLADGTLELVVVYDFKDINQLTFYMVPSFDSTDPRRKGDFRLTYARVIFNDWHKKYFKQDQMNVQVTGKAPEQKSSSPSVVQDYRQVAPIFQDMLNDLRFEIQIKGPDDLEAYESGDMVSSMPIDGNVVTAYRVYGENVVLDSEVVRGFLMGEHRGGSVRGLPNTVSPYSPSGERGMAVRFLKTPAEVPAPAAEPKK